ncbi:MAG: hypothetical protein LBL90_00530 [Prevotellaceae bacterium]|jgi:hypothetical protein|nr:hypothetical protein [Prevotellaceae bacterium]
MSRGKNALKKAYICKALSFLNSELELLWLKIQYPEQFSPAHLQIRKSNLFCPKTENVVDYWHIRNCCRLALLGRNNWHGRKTHPAYQYCRAFEPTFNLDFGDIYDKQEATFDRKPFNRTKALDTLKNAILREAKKRDIQ